MICYKIDLSRMMRIMLLGKESLSATRVHYTRYVGEYLLYVVTRGYLDLLVNDERITIREGECYLFKRGDYQEPMSNPECEYYYVHFTADGEQIEELEVSEDGYRSLLDNKRAENLKSQFYSLSCYDFMYVYLRRHTRISSKGLFEYITSILKGSKINDDAKLASRRFEISAAFADVLFKIESSDEAKINSRYSTVHRIVEYIEQNYSKPISGEDIERDLFINFDYANRLLSQTIGYSIIKYRNLVRINNAKVMIRTSNRPLSAIGMAVGFESGYYFSRAFKKAVGVSPSEYRHNALYGETKKVEEYEKN